MGRDHADAWRHLPPFKHMLEAIEARSAPALEPEPSPDDIPIHVKVTGTRVTVRINPPGEPALRVQFRWRESHREWQFFAHEGSRWVADGPPRPSVGRLLETLMIGIMNANSLLRRVPG